MRRRLFVAATLIAAAGLAGVVPASADPAQPVVVSTNPVDYTPHILDGTVWAITVVGDTVVVGGSFSEVTDSTGTRRYTRKNIFAYGLRDGAIRPFAPAVDSAVYALAPGAGNTVYIGGAFKNVSGVAQRGLAQLSLATGQRVAAFGSRINWGDVRSMSVRGQWLYVGGTFTAINGVSRIALARLYAARGWLDTNFDARITAPGLSRARVEHFDVSPDGRRLVAVGAILKVNGVDRVQIAQLDVSGPRAVLINWWTDAYRPKCEASFETYLRQVKFSPDASYFVVVATGRQSHPAKLCDSAARFETARVGAQRPTWVNLTGGDSLYSVAVTGAAVYVGGHQKYLNNPYGTDDGGPGPGAVARPGIGALDPRTGRALAWNPTKSRGVGVRAFAAVPEGLLVGSDTEKLGKEYHARIGMFPLR